MSAAGFCPRCGHVVGTIHSRPECDANYDYAYKRRMAQLEARRPEPVCVQNFTGCPPWLDNPYAR